MKLRITTYLAPEGRLAQFVFDTARNAAQRVIDISGRTRTTLCRPSMFMRGMRCGWEADYRAFRVDYYVYPHVPTLLERYEAAVQSTIHRIEDSALAPLRKVDLALRRRGPDRWITLGEWVHSPLYETIDERSWEHPHARFAVLRELRRFLEVPLARFNEFTADLSDDPLYAGRCVGEALRTRLRMDALLDDVALDADGR